MSEEIMICDEGVCHNCDWADRAHQLEAELVAAQKWVEEKERYREALEELRPCVGHWPWANKIVLAALEGSE